jgi:RNA polymerase sigma-70 factor, ECF subfamily
MGYARDPGLDHRRVIQLVQLIVFIGMHWVALCVTLPATRLFPFRRIVGPSARREPQRRMSMRYDNPVAVDENNWGGLIRAVAADRDRVAFARLFDYFAPRVKSFMLRSGVAAATAEELAQETMLTVWRKADLFEPASAGAAAWIFTIARNLRIDAHRREQRAGQSMASDIDTEFQVDESPQPDAVFGANEVERRVRAALTELSAEQTRVIELSFFEEKAHAEIAQILGIPLGTVKSRLRLAMKRLRDLLGELS